MGIWRASRLLNLVIVWHFVGVFGGLYSVTLLIRAVIAMVI
jgi:hypothetical protein